MYKIFFLFFIALSINVSSQNEKESPDYKYTSLGIHLVDSDKSGFAINLSLDLPGPFYTTLERKADGVDFKNESYDKIVDTVRLGAHSGIGDLIANMSPNNFNLKIKNIFDVYAEVGIKTSDFDGERINFEGDDTHASYVVGMRFGNSNLWEGKIFIDASKEAIIIDTGNPVCKALNCPKYDAAISKDADKKFGIGFLYNINNRSGLFFEASSSDILETSFKVGYQLNF